MEEEIENVGGPSSKKLNPMMFIGGVVAIGVALVLVLQISKPNSPAETQPTADSMMTTTEEMPALGATDEESGDVSIEVEGGSFYFKPNEIRVKVGDRVKITLNSVSIMHDFVIDELNVKSATAPAGQSTTVEFMADKTGTFEYYCSVGNHRAQGQIGKLIVE